MKPQPTKCFIRYSCLVLTAIILTSCRKTETKPLLLLVSKEHFGRFTSEILRTEGFAALVVDSLNDPKVSVKYLTGFDVVVLSQVRPDARQKDMFTTYVQQGGNLIAFRPDESLHDMFGMKSNGLSHDGYVSIDNTSDIGKGLLSQQLQVHGEADEYELSRGITIANIHTRSRKATPAVVINQHGSGNAVAFAYNLPESIVYTRQGNPENAGLEKDGILGLRAMDLFTHGFVDTSKNTLNQADEQMRLLTHVIEALSSSTKPVPRLWYFPDSLKCVVTLNNDGEDSKEQEFLNQFNDVEAHGGLMTLYVKEPQLISKVRIDEWTKRGFEISGHPDDTRQASHPDWRTMDSVYADLQDRLKSNFNIPPMKTITNHWFVWVGNNADGSKNFAAQAKIEELHGIALDCNYAHYDNGSDQGHFLGQMGLQQGNYTGTGLTMKFANQDGTIIDTYQQLNNVYDQQYMEHQDQDGYFNAFKGIMDRSLYEEVYSTISVRAHNNEYFFSKIPLLNMLDYARNNNIPVWTELMWLEFLQAKDSTSFHDVEWKNDHLTFEVRSSLAFERQLACLIPERFSDVTVSTVTIDGNQTSHKLVTIKGTRYARIFVTPGVNSIIDVAYKQ